MAKFKARVQCYVEQLATIEIEADSPEAAAERIIPVAAGERRGDRVRERSVAVVDANRIVTVAGVDVDRRDPAAGKREVGRAVIADVVDRVAIP